MRTKISVLFVMTLMAFVVGCTKVPISGRKQMNLMPESEMIAMSLTAYNDFLSSSTVVSESDSRSQMVTRVGQKIAASVEKFLADNGQSKRVEGFEWEFKLVQEETVNAWCMPGGKVVVYTGILPLTQDETGLAVVMGHEIAHAVARHGNERMSQQMMVQAGGMTLGVLTSEQPELARNIFLESYGIGSTLGVLAYSRNHETEADKLGLVFMAMSGYDPKAAIPFWERMSAQGGEAPPELMSTHPSDATRIQSLQEFMPEALKYYKP